MAATIAYGSGSKEVSPLQMSSSLPEFALEVYFATYEFSAKYLLCCSDAESFSLAHILSLCDDETRSMWEGLTLNYTEAPGLPLLREEIAKQYYRYSIGGGIGGASKDRRNTAAGSDELLSQTAYPQQLNADNVICFAGAEEGVYACMRALLCDEDHVVVVTPAYQSLVSIAAAAVRDTERGGAGITMLDLEVQAGTSGGIKTEAARWTLDLNRLRQSIQPGKTKMVIINFPHNPTGALLTAEEQRQVIDICRESDCWLFSDEVYRGLEMDANRRLPPACNIYHKAFSLGVMSKSLGMAGLRVGWLASQDTASLTLIAKYKHYLSICNSAPSEILSLIALRSQTSLLQRNRDIVKANLVHVERFLQGRFGKYFDWTPPEAGCVGFMRFKGNPENPTGTLEMLAHTLVTEHGCLILPGKYFPAAAAPAAAAPAAAAAAAGAPLTLVVVSGQFDSHFRFGFGRANFAECLQRLELALDSVLGANA